MPESTAAILTNALRTLHPTGPIGFEGLIACLLQKLTGHRFFLSASGRQEGRDMRARTEFGTHIAVECKRYLKSTALDERELVAELAQAINSLPGLDLWVLVTSRSVPDQIERTLRDHAHENGVAFAILESLDDSIGDLAVLCAEFANEVASYLPERAQEDAQRALEAIRASVGFASAIARPMSSVLAWPPISGVRGPVPNTELMASITACAAAGSPKCSNIIAPAQIWPIGLAIFLP